MRGEEVGEGEGRCMRRRWVSGEEVGEGGGRCMRVRWGKRWVRGEEVGEREVDERGGGG